MGLWINLTETVILTVLLELPVVYAFLRKYKPERFVGNVILINMITNIALNLVRLVFFPESVIFTLVGEIVVVLIEAEMFAFAWREKIPLGRLLLTSFVANLFSVAVGGLILAIL